MAGVVFFAGCSTTSSPQRGVDYPAPVVTPSPPRAGDAGTPTREWRAAGAGLDAAFERSAFLADSFYRNADALLQQVEKSGAMGVNRGFELAARKGGEWFIEEQRFADTVIGAGVNRNRMDLIDAGLRALEWGYAQQSGDGSFPCRDNFLGGSYFVAATAHSLWLLETTGYARSYTARINALRPKLERAAHWLADNSHPAAVLAQQDAYSSRHFLTGYALEKALALDASFLDAHKNLAILCHTRNPLYTDEVRTKKALEHYAKYFELGGQDKELESSYAQFKAFMDEYLGKKPK